MLIKVSVYIFQVILISKNQLLLGWFSYYFYSYQDCPSKHSNLKYLLIQKFSKYKYLSISSLLQQLLNNKRINQQMEKFIQKSTHQHKPSKENSKKNINKKQQELQFEKFKKILNNSDPQQLLDYIERSYQELTQYENIIVKVNEALVQKISNFSIIIDKNQRLKLNKILKQGGVTISQIEYDMLKNYEMSYKKLGSMGYNKVLSRFSQNMHMEIQKDQDFLYAKVFLNYGTKKQQLKIVVINEPPLFQLKCNVTRKFKNESIEVLKQIISYTQKINQIQQAY